MTRASENQLSYWTKLGYLAGMTDEIHAPRNADWRDTHQALDARARAYLDINCGHCPQPERPAKHHGAGLSIFANADRYLGVCKPPVAAGRGTGDHFFDLVPGKPQDSILPFRMRSSEPGVIIAGAGPLDHHREGVQLIEEWISAMQGPCSPARTSEPG